MSQPIFLLPDAVYKAAMTAGSSLTVSVSASVISVTMLVSKLIFVSACKTKDVMEVAEQPSAPKKPRLVFTDLQRRTLQAIFKVPPTPSLGTSLVPWFCLPLGI